MVMDVRQRTTWHGDSRSRAIGMGFEGMTWIAVDWHDQGSCFGLNDDSFFMTEDDMRVAGASLEKVRKAKELCFSCPVQQLCLDDALAHKEQSGIWGGATTPERTVMADQIAHGKTPSLPIPPHELAPAFSIKLTNVQTAIVDLAMQDFSNEEIALKLDHRLSVVGMSLRKASKANGFAYQVEDFLDHLDSIGWTP